jgi:tetratricopeptide (TPR) repeat protein
MSSYTEARALLPDQAAKASEIMLDALNRAVQINASSDSLVAKCYYLLGVSEYYQSHFYLAQNYYQKALQTAFGKQPNILQESCWNNIGIVLDKQNKLPEALAAYNKSLAIAEQRGDSLSIVQSWINIGLLQSKTRQYAEAIVLTKRALDFATQKRDTVNMGLCLQNLGKFYFETGRYSLFDKYTLQAIELFSRDEDRYYLTKLLINLADQQSSRNEWDKSKRTVEKAMQIAVDNNFIESKALLHRLLAIAALGEGDYAAAEKNLLQAQKLFEQVERTDVLDKLQVNFMTLYFRTGNYEKYSEALKNYEKYIDQRTNANALAAYQEMQAMYELNKITAELSLVKEELLLRQRVNRLLITLLVVILLAVTIFIIQRIRERALVKSLFQLNIREVVNRDDLRSTNRADDATEYLHEPQQNPMYILYQTLMDRMAAEKWYTDPNLNRRDICIKLATNQKYISQAISDYSNSNLYGIIKNFRVNEARRLILTQGSGMPLTEIAEKSGFANRVSFYRQFKEVTGFSPTEFARLALDPSQRPGLEEEPYTEEES